MSTNIHSAQAPMLGYRFQPLYALLVLWKEAEDDFDEVSVETEDDVVLKGRYTKLYQLKHSMGKPQELTLKNDGFWKTIRIWSPYSNLNMHKLFFVTGDHVSVSNPLYKLVKGNSDRSEIIDSMVKEARSVIDAREKAISSNAQRLPYENKIHGCKAFMQLNSQERKALIDKITIRTDNFNILQVQNQVIGQLSQMVINKLRPLIAQSLIQWWDNRILNSSKITKSELLLQLQNLIAQIQDNNLPDDFSKLIPTSVENEIGGNMEKQIDLVGGGFSRKKRAAIARWRARNQREKWISDDILNVIELNDYDQQLVESWADRHEPLKEDTEHEVQEQCKKRGLELLDWTHNEAYLHVNPIRSEWKQHFLIQGSYQQLSEELRVGWHPKFAEILREDT